MRQHVLFAKFLALVVTLFVTLALVAASLVVSLPSAHATPWADSDDVQVRHNLQILADAGVVNLSVSTYPLMWGALLEVLQGVDVRNLRQHERNAYLQVMAVLDFHRQGGYTAGEISVQSNNHAERGFGQRQHEKGALEITRELKGEHSAFRLQTAWRTGRETRFGRRDQQELSFAGTYLATVVTSETFGSWVLSADQLYTWWSPSYENDGMHTRSVRPLHALRVTRAGAAPSSLPVLQWLGPWSATAYVGRSERLVGVPELIQYPQELNDNGTYTVPARREEAFGMRVTANPHRLLQLGARFTGAHLQRTAKNAAVDARFVLPGSLSFSDQIGGQLAFYGELITHQSDIDETYHTLGADYSFAYGGAGNAGSARITNARVYAEHLLHQQKETIAFGFSQFKTSGLGFDVRLRHINYQPGYYHDLYFHKFQSELTTLEHLNRARFGNQQERQQADVTVYFPLREGRLTAGVQAWRDTYASSTGNSLEKEADVNVFLSWEIRW